MVLLYEDFDGEDFQGQGQQKLFNQIVIPGITYAWAGIVSGLVLGLMLRRKE